MKKLMIFLMAALVLTGTLLVSCNQNVGEDKLGSVTISQDMARTLSSTAESTLPGSDDIAWFYKAVKNDDGFFVTGQTNGFVSLTGTLSGKNLGNFSYGDWLFSFEGRDSGSNVIYSCYDLPATINNPQTNLTVPLTIGSGAAAPTVVFKGLSFKLAEGSGSEGTTAGGNFKLIVSEGTEEIFSVTESTTYDSTNGVSFTLSNLLSGYDDTEGGVLKTYGAAASHTYGFKVEFQKSGSSTWQTVADRTYSVLIPFGAKITISGSVDSIETTGQAIIDGTETHNYAINSDGSWQCSNGHDTHTLAGTDSAYITVIQNGQPTEIIPLTENATVGNGSITVDGSNVTYTNTSDHAQTVVIRTTSTDAELTVEAATDEVRHYDHAGSLNIKAVAGNSYHENGTVHLIAIKQGHVKLEGGADVKGIHVYNGSTDTQKDTSFAEIKISVVQGVDVPKLSRSAVEIADEGTKVCTIVTDQAKDVYLFNEGIYEQIKTVDEGKEITHESASWANSNANTENTQTAAQQLANEFNGTYDANGKIADQEIKVETGENAGDYRVKFNDDTRVFETYKVENETETPVINAAVVEEVIEAIVDTCGTTIAEAEVESILRGTGRIGDPYLIYNLNDFKNCEAITENAKTMVYFKVMEDFADTDPNRCTYLYYADIDLNGHTITLATAHSFICIVKDVVIHNGKIHWDGGSSLCYLPNSDSSNVKATFNDLELTGKIITNSTHFGPIFSYLYEASHKGTYQVYANNILNKLTIIGQNSDVGGLFGYVQGSKITASVTNCTFAGYAQGSKVGGFLNCTSYPEAKPIVNSGNSVTGSLVAADTVRPFGLNGNYDPYIDNTTKDSLESQNALVNVASGSLVTLSPSSSLLEIASETSAISVVPVEGASYYIVEIEYWVTRNADGSGGYPRTIQVRLDAAGNSGLKAIDFIQVNSEPDSSTALLNFDAAKVWEENGTYKIYDPYYTMYHNSANWYIRAYAFDSKDTLKAFQTTKR